MADSEDRLLSVAEVATLLSVTEPTIREWMPESHARIVMQDGWLPVFLITTEPNRPVYTLAGDYPVPGPVRRD